MTQSTLNDTINKMFVVLFNSNIYPRKYNHILYVCVLNINLYVSYNDNNLHFEKVSGKLPLENSPQKNFQWRSTLRFLEQKNLRNGGRLLLPAVCFHSDAVLFCLKPVFSRHSLIQVATCQSACVSTL